ncbi:MAG TPA: DUF4097 family beta strand repeat-containing protein [Thermoanaerobaculia bacterium]|nr:DUF4097 family beta strand repeat-containing protein [Thermoanaerobaculia bacterium]
MFPHPTSRRRLAAALFVLVLVARLPAGAERLTLPIADPAQPVQLEVSLPNGSIEVVGSDTREVIVVFGEPDEVERGGQPEKVDGMYRIPNRGFGLTAEADGNRVEVGGGWGDQLTVRIEVPRRTSMSLHSISGDVMIVRNVEGDLELNCINGDIEVRDVTGSVIAHSTNGDIEVVLTGLGERKPMSFITFNGDIDVTFPAGFASDLRISSMQGEIYSDFELVIEPTTAQVDRDAKGVRYRVEREIHATVGGGGEETRFKTFNGDVFLRRGAR